MHHIFGKLTKKKRKREREREHQSFNNNNKIYIFFFCEIKNTIFMYPIELEKQLHDFFRQIKMYVREVNKQTNKCGTTRIHSTIF